MHLPYRPKFLPFDHESGRRRVQRRLGLVKRTPFAPEPHIAPAAMVEDRGRIYTPGPVLIDRDGVCLFHDGPAASWPKGREPAIGPPYAPLIPAWRLWLEGALLVAAIILGGIVWVRL